MKKAEWNLHSAWGKTTDERLSCGGTCACPTWASSAVNVIAEEVNEHVIDEPLDGYAAPPVEPFEAPDGVLVDGPSAAKVAFHASPPTLRAAGTQCRVPRG